MVKQLQKKFIISAMLAVTILLVVLIGGINVFNYLTTSGDNDRLMEMLCYSFETSTKWNADTTDASGSQNNPDFPPQDNGTKPPDDKRTTALADTIKTQWILHAMPPLRLTKRQYHKDGCNSYILAYRGRSDRYYRST